MAQGAWSMEKEKKNFIEASARGGSAFGGNEGNEVEELSAKGAKRKNTMVRQHTRRLMR